MFTKAIAKAAVATATAGALLLPTTGTVSPSIVNVACSYPDSVATTTNIDVDKPIMRKGQKNWADVRVRSNAGTPKGTVRFKIQGRKAVVHRLRDGRTRFVIPRNLKAGRTYGIDAYYKATCRFRDSSDSAYVTVIKKRR